MTTSVSTSRWLGPEGLLNTRYHKMALMIYAAVVIGHWAEHVAQAIQVYALHWPRPQANGALGLWFPVLVKSEWLHYGYAVLMMIAFIILRHGFTGQARTWWNVAMWIQIWHHFEHLLLLVQAMTGAYLLGAKVPTSIAQLVFPRIELHLFYNTIVTIPMVVAMVKHLRPSPEERALMRCSCAKPATLAAPATAS
jgi:hypothetical protein